jgi:hypothetical protein
MLLHCMLHITERSALARSEAVVNKALTLIIVTVYRGQLAEAVIDIFVKIDNLLIVTSI